MKVNAGWQKVDEYYERLDDSAVYVAAVVLHPRMKWRDFKAKRVQLDIGNRHRRCH